ncbi:MAG: Holliday junction branch migration protein RuvA [Spirochaetia bacterium]
MFNSLIGVVTEYGTNYLYLMTNESLEWTIYTTTHTINNIKKTGKQRILIYTQFKEDGVTLFGFVTEAERSLFKNLIKVNGIGPKAAMKAISGSSIKELLLALENGDTDMIANIPGIGKKTAEKIIFTLKGKIEPQLADGETNKTIEIVESLVTMGYDKRMALNTVREIQSSPGSEEINEGLLIQQAIVRLSSKKN